MNMYLVYEYVQAVWMESPINECDMHIFLYPSSATAYAENRRCALRDDGLCDFYNEFKGWKFDERGRASCTLYYKTPTSVASGEPKEYVEIRVQRLRLPPF